MPTEKAEGAWPSLLVWPGHKLVKPKNSSPVRIRHFPELSETAWFCRFKQSFLNHQQTEMGLTCLWPEQCLSLCDLLYFLPYRLPGTGASVLACSGSPVFVGRPEQ